MKSKKTFVVNDDQIDIKTYNYRKTQNPLQDIHIHHKDYRCSNKREQRKEVKTILFSWMTDFVKTRLMWKKLPKYFRNDSRTILTQYFIGKYYRMVMKDDGKIRKNVRGKPNNIGKLIMDTIKMDQPGFTEIEILDTLIQVMYKNHIDHYSLKLKTVKPAIKENDISLWDKISEKVF